MGSEPFNPYTAPLTEPEGFDPFQQDDVRVRRQFINCEANVTSIAGLLIAGGLLLALFAAIFAVVLGAGSRSPGTLAVLMVLVPFGILQMLVGFGVRKLHPPARIAAIVFCSIWLLFVPVGTVFGGVCLWYLGQPAAFHVFTAEYRDVIRRTPQVRFRTSAVSWGILAILVLGLLGLVLVATL